MRLSIFTYHVQSIATTPAPAKFSLGPCDGVLAEVEITPAPNGLDTPVWDQVTINGKSAGNRSGGVKAFTELVAQVKPEIEWD